MSLCSWLIIFISKPIFKDVSLLKKTLSGLRYSRCLLIISKLWFCRLSPLLTHVFWQQWVTANCFVSIRNVKLVPAFQRGVRHPGLLIEARFHRSSGGCESLSHQPLGHVHQQILEKWQLQLPAIRRAYTCYKSYSLSGGYNLLQLAHFYPLNSDISTGKRYQLFEHMEALEDLFHVCFIDRT